MEMQKLMALFMLCLATTTPVAWCRKVDTSMPQEMTNDQDKQRAEAWADWAASKISEGVGASSNGHKIMASSKVSREMMGEKLYDVKSHTSEAASGGMQTAKETARNSYESMSGQGRKTMESAAEMADEAEKQANKAYEASGPTMESASNTASDMAGKAKDEASKAYEASGPAMESAGNYASDMAGKAKDEASKAYEASGPTMESASNIASDMAEKIKEGAQSAYEYAASMVHISMDESVHPHASNKEEQGMSDASGKSSNAMETMKEKATDAYNSLFHKTGETVRMATEAHRIATENTMSASYAQAREKAYDAYLYTGDKFEGAKEAAAAHANKQK